MEIPQCRNLCHIEGCYPLDAEGFGLADSLPTRCPNETTRVHHAVWWYGDPLAVSRARAAGRPDATDRRSNGLCRERPGRTGLRRRIPGGTPEARVGRRPQHSDRRSLGGGRHGVDATIREGTRRATARPHSFEPHTYHDRAATTNTHT